MNNAVLPKGQTNQIHSVDCSHTINKVIRKSVCQIGHCFCAASIITCGMLLVALCFRFNPYLSNTSYQKDPQANMINLLISTVPPCSIVLTILQLLLVASFFLGCFDLKKNVVSTKLAILMVFTNNMTHSNIFISATAYPCLLLLINQLIEWDTFKTFSIQIFCLMVVICLSTWICYAVATYILSKHLLRPDDKALSDSLIDFRRYGIMKKIAKKKVLLLQRVRAPFLLSAPILMIGLFICLFGITTRYCLQQSNTFMSFYCLSIVLIKTILQWLLRRYIMSSNVGNSRYHQYTIVLTCTVLLDCIVRLVFSQVKSTANFIMLTVSLGVIELCIRCFSVFRAIGMAKRAINMLHCKETKTLRIYIRQAKRYITLIVIKIEAGVISEYVAINSTFIMNCFFGNYIGFIVGKNGLLELKKQFMYLIWQYCMEFVVDFIAFLIETFRPELEEIMAEQLSPSSLGKISTSLAIGVCCMLILIMLVVD